jgi:hypothetical protein
MQAGKGWFGRPVMGASVSETGVTAAVEASDNAVHAAIHTYWNVQRGDRQMPRRSQMRPGDMKDHLGWLSILEALPDYRDFRYRLLGSRVTQYFGGDSTGHTLREIYGLTTVKPERIDDLVTMHKVVCTNALPLRLRGAAGVWGGRTHPKYDSLYLPLADETGAPKLVLMAFTFDYKTYREENPALEGSALR